MKITNWNETRKKNEASNDALKQPIICLKRNFPLTITKIVEMSVSKAKTSWFSQCKNESQEERERDMEKRVWSKDRYGREWER